MRIPKQVKVNIEAEEFDPVISTLEPLANDGGADAEFLLGYLYFTSAEVEAEWARGWLEKAAGQNHPEACYYLARFRQDGSSGIPKTEEGLALLHRAADLGSSQAQYDLGACYATAVANLPLDGARSRHYYQLAANQGNVDAQYNLASMLLDGEGGQVDVERGLTLLTEAVSRDEPDAMSTCAAELLALIYGEGLYGVERNPAMADRWERRRQQLDERPFRTLPDWFYEATVNEEAIAPD